MLASLITVLYNTMDKLMLGGICGDGETGIYDTAYFISFIWGFIPNAIMNSYRPVIIEGHARNINYKERIRTLYSVLIWLGILAGIGTLAAGRFAILTIGGVIINLILNALTIPRYGAAGASFSTLVTQITVLSQSHFCTDRPGLLSLICSLP